LARKALYKHATVVDINTYPDDGSSPVGTNEWNADPDANGMLGFTPANATITIASGVATITDSICVIAAESGTSDVLDKLAIANTNQYDLVYLFADTGDTITLTHTSSPSADGHISTVSGVNETLSTTVPKILIRKGTYWYGYGGGIVDAISDVGDVTITSVGDNEVLAYDNSSSKWINQTPTEAGVAKLASPTFTGTVNAADLTLSGDLTVNGTNTIINSTTLTVDDKNIEIASVASPSDTTADGAGITVKGSTDKTINWVNSTDAWTFNQNLDLSTNHLDLARVSAPASPATNYGRVYAKQIDSNNDGLFIKIKKAGAFVEVQIA